MSIEGKRLEFAEALALVADVVGFPYKPSTPRPGDGWPIFTGAERDEETGMFALGWRVLMYLPQDQRAASMWIDEHIADLIEALYKQGVAYVDAFIPVNIGTTDSYIYGLMLTTRSE